jgi:hypothetical protein
LTLPIILTYLLVKLYLSKNYLCFKQFNSSTTTTIKNQQTETTNISFLDTNSNQILIPANSLGFSTNSVKTSSTSPISNITTTTTSGGSSSFTEHDNSEQQQHFYESKSASASMMQMQDADA